MSLELQTLKPVQEGSYSARESSTVLTRARRVRGHIEAVERALNQDAGCSGILQLIADARGAVNDLMAEVLVDHIRMRVVDTDQEFDVGRAHAAEEMIDVVRSYLK